MSITLDTALARAVFQGRPARGSGCYLTADSQRCDFSDHVQPVGYQPRAGSRVASEDGDAGVDAEPSEVRRVRRAREREASGIVVIRSSGVALLGVGKTMQCAA